MYFIWYSEETGIVFRNINRQILLEATQCVLYAVGTEFLNITYADFGLQRVNYQEIEAEYFILCQLSWTSYPYGD
jgi:hypothetical protein